MAPRGGEEHTYGAKCLPCSEPAHYDQAGRRLLAICDHARYSPARIAFIRAHWEEAETIALAPTHSTSRRLLARWAREMARLPRRHACDCVCPNQRDGCPQWGSPKHNPRNHRCAGAPQPSCLHCSKVNDREQYIDVAIEVGRTEPVEAPMPDAEWLDLIAAMDATGSENPLVVCAYLNTERKAAA